MAAGPRNEEFLVDFLKEFTARKFEWGIVSIGDQKDTPCLIYEVDSSKIIDVKFDSILDALRKKNLIELIKAPIGPPEKPTSIAYIITKYDIEKIKSFYLNDSLREGGKSRDKFVFDQVLKEENKNRKEKNKETQTRAPGLGFGKKPT